MREWARRIRATRTRLRRDAPGLGGHPGHRGRAAGLPPLDGSAPAHARRRASTRWSGWPPTRARPTSSGRLVLDRRARPFDRIPSTRVSPADRRRLWDAVVRLAGIADPASRPHPDRSGMTRIHERLAPTCRSRRPSTSSRTSRTPTPGIPAPRGRDGPSRADGPDRRRHDLRARRADGRPGRADDLPDHAASSARHGSSSSAPDRASMPSTTSGSSRAASGTAIDYTADIRLRGIRRLLAAVPRRHVRADRTGCRGRAWRDTLAALAASDGDAGADADARRDHRGRDQRPERRLRPAPRPRHRAVRRRVAGRRPRQDRRRSTPPTGRSRSTWASSSTTTSPTRRSCG